MKNTFTYNLPNNNGTPTSHSTENNSLIIIGGNGAGKTRLGEWMEKQDELRVHRIGAQRSLSIKKYVPQRSHEESMQLLMRGRVGEQQRNNNRWSYEDGEWNYSTSLLNDYEYVLSAIFAKHNIQVNNFYKECKAAKEEGIHSPSVPDTIITKIVNIWDRIFPQRSIKLEDGKVSALYNPSSKNNASSESKEYVGKKMSDGERVALYFIGQVLCIDDNMTIIIDEPELHLHRSIMNKLWSELERERPKCFFVYITHDTMFAATHMNADKIWVRSFDGSNRWEIEPLTSSELPEELLLRILGNRRKVLFVEGNENSYDVQLYSKYYTEYHVIPCGSCEQVISNTKALRKINEFHQLDCYGIVDRDFRSEKEIESLKKDYIYTIDVAEIENLFITEEILEIVSDILLKNEHSVVNEIVNQIVDEKCKPILQQQIHEATMRELTFKISSIKAEPDDKIKEKITELYISIKSNIYMKYKNALTNRNYKDILRLFNSKEIAKTAGKYFKHNNDDYIPFVLRKMDNIIYKNQIVNALRLYLPIEIPAA